MAVSVVNTLKPIISLDSHGNSIKKELVLSQFHTGSQKTSRNLVTKAEHADVLW